MNKQTKVDFKLLPSLINKDIKINMKSIYFMHIPKCGGTTIDNIFLKLSLTLGSFKFKRFKYPNLKHSNKFMLENIDDDIPIFISGHLDYNFTKNIKNIFTCAILRNPLDRVISHYKFQALKSKKTPSQFSFEEFIEKEVASNRDNLITRHFAGCLGVKKNIVKHDTEHAIKNLDKFDRVNIFENWDYFVSDLLSIFDLPSVFYSKFQEHHYKFLFKPDEYEFELIKKNYEHDFILYDYVCGVISNNFIPKNSNYKKKICIVSPFLETDNRLFTQEEVKDIFQKKNESETRSK
jgi:hypothetical protein